LGGSYSTNPANFSSRTATTGSGSNWGLRGREDLGRGMYAGFQIETSIQGDALSPISATASGTAATYRNTGLWLGTPFGEFGSGIWDTPYAMLMNTTGVHGQVYGNSSTSAAAAIFGGLPFAATTYSGQPINQTCNVGTASFLGTSAKGCFASVTTFSRRQGTTIWYQSPSWSGFKVRGQYKVNHGDSTSDTATIAGGGVTAPNALKTSIWGLSGTYTNGPLFVGVGYERHNDLAAFGIRTWGTNMILGTTAAGVPIAQFEGRNIAGSDAHAWNINARYTFGGGFSGGIYYERINWNFEYGNTLAGVAPLASNVTNLDKKAYRLDVAYQTGPHTIGLMYNRAQDIGGSTLGMAFNGNDTGIQSWQLGYGYSFSKRTSLFGYWTQVTNDRNAQSAGIVFNGLTPAVGGDPRYYGVGLRHTF
jgi:predicted porin